MSDAFNEVQDELRQERLAQLWRAYGNYLIGFVVGVIVLTAAVSAYQYFDHKQKVADTDALYALIEQPDFYANLNAEASDLHGQLEVMALMQGAGAAMAADDQVTALHLYDQVAALPAGKAGPYHGLALLMVARLDSNQAEGLYQAILVDKNSIWRPYAALELSAYYGQQGDVKRAVSVLDQLNTLTLVPEAVTMQAKALRHVLNVKLSQASS